MSKTVRVLICDDQDSARRGLRALLTYFPQVQIVGEAANGQEAVQLTESCQPDVVLMDAQMPRMDGLEATRRIKNQYPAIRVVLLTFYSFYQREALAAGADRFLLKGCSAAALQNAILNPRTT